MDVSVSLTSANPVLQSEEHNIKHSFSHNIWIILSYQKLHIERCLLTLSFIQINLFFIKTCSIQIFLLSFLLSSAGKAVCCVLTSGYTGPWRGITSTLLIFICENVMQNSIFWPLHLELGTSLYVCSLALIIDRLEQTGILCTTKDFNQMCSALKASCSSARVFVSLYERSV